MMEIMTSIYFRYV